VRAAAAMATVWRVPRAITKGQLELCLFYTFLELRGQITVTWGRHGE